MAITVNDIQYLAELSRLNFNADEIQSYQKDLDKILNHAQDLQQVDTTNIPPTSHPIKVDTFFRIDEVVPFKNVEQLLANGPEIEDHGFKVPRIL